MSVPKHDVRLPFRDALRMEVALAERGEPTPAPPGSLRSIARNLLNRADTCTLAAREVADRLDGKPAQALDMQSDVVQRYISERPMTADEWRQQYCEEAAQHDSASDCALAVFVAKLFSILHPATLPMLERMFKDVRQDVETDGELEMKWHAEIGLAAARIALREQAAFES